MLDLSSTLDNKEKLREGKTLPNDPPSTEIRAGYLRYADIYGSVSQFDISELLNPFHDVLSSALDNKEKLRDGVPKNPCLDFARCYNLLSLHFATCYDLHFH